MGYVDWLAREVKLVTKVRIRFQKKTIELNPKQRFILILGEMGSPGYIVPGPKGERGDDGYEGKCDSNTVHIFNMKNWFLQYCNILVRLPIK